MSEGRKQFEQEYANTAKWKQFVAPDNKHIYGSWYESGWQAGRASLEEENRRLREALRKIQAGDGEHYCDCEHDTPECCVNVDYFCPHCIAGAALAGKSGEVGNGS